MLETRGIATVALGLVRYQMEQTRPPRGLWTPFQLGRPLGEPENPAFQRRVIMQALRLLERQDGPVILEDFPDDPSGWSDQPGWQPPNLTPSDDFAAELAEIHPAWMRAQSRYGRTTVGLSALPPEAWPRLAAAVIAGELPQVPPHETTALAARFMADDIKALYSEAAQADGPAPASRQINDWFWSRTAAAQTLRALRTTALASENNALKTVGARFFVPTPFI